MADVSKYVLRVFMPDAAQLSEHKNLSHDGYILKAIVPDSSTFVRVVTIPSVLDMLGAGVGGIVGYAFKCPVVENQVSDPRYYMTALAGKEFSLPTALYPVNVGVTTLSGVLYGHFELDYPANDAWMAAINVPVISAVEYAPSFALADLLQLRTK